MLFIKNNNFKNVPEFKKKNGEITTRNQAILIGITALNSAYLIILL